MSTDTTMTDLEIVKSSLNLAKEFDLEVEVVYFALRSMQENPQLSIREALFLGVSEMIK